MPTDPISAGSPAASPAGSGAGIPDEVETLDESPTLLRLRLQSRPCSVCRATGQALQGATFCECTACRGTGYASLVVQMVALPASE